MRGIENLLRVPKEIQGNAARLTTLRATVVAAERQEQRLAAVHKVLLALSRDWRQPLNQAVKTRDVARIALLHEDFGLNHVPRLPIESGTVLMWPEELVTYEHPKNGLDFSLASVKNGAVRPLKDAVTRPCPDCGTPAFVVCNVHDAKRKGSSRNAAHLGQHAQFLLLCADCPTVRACHEDFETCGGCVT